MSVRIQLLLNKSHDEQNYSKWKTWHLLFLKCQRLVNSDDDEIEGKLWTVLAVQFLELVMSVAWGVRLPPPATPSRCCMRCEVSIAPSATPSQCCMYWFAVFWTASLYLHKFIRLRCFLWTIFVSLLDQQILHFRLKFYSLCELYYHVEIKSYMVIFAF